jgi:hypothetical protein
VNKFGLSLEQVDICGSEQSFEIPGEWEAYGKKCVAAAFRNSEDIESESTCEEFGEA